MYPTAIQFARLSGFSPIITTASPRNFDLVSSLGATHPLDRSEPLSISDITSKPVNIVYDAISLPETQTAGYKVLAKGGKLILVLPAAVPDEEKESGDAKEILNPMGSAASPGNKAFGKELYEQLEGYLESGDIKVRGLLSWCGISQADVGCVVAKSG